MLWAVLLVIMMCVSVTPDIVRQFRMGDVLMNDEPEVWRSLHPDDTNSVLDGHHDTMRWLRDSGAVFDMVEPRLFETPHLADEVAGMVAARRFAAGEVLMSIPERLLLTPDNVLRRLPSKLAAAARSQGLPPSDTLRLFLTHRKSRQKSPWAAWLSRAVVADPFSPAEPSSTGHNTLRKASADSVLQGRTSWKEALRKLLSDPKAGGFPARDLGTEEEWWAALHFMDKNSRSLGMRGHTVALVVPGMDMFQTRFGQTAWGWSQEDASVVLYAVQPIDRGEAVFVEGPLLRKSLYARLQHPVGLCLSWMAQVHLPEAPPAQCDDATWFYAAPPVAREMRNRKWLYTLTLTQPPTELLGALRLKLRPRVAEGELRVMDAEVQVLHLARDSLSAEFDKMGGMGALMSLTKWLCITRAERNEKANRLIDFQQMTVLRHHMLILDMLADHLQRRGSLAQPLGHASAAEEHRQSHAVPHQLYKAVYALSTVASRLHRINTLLNATGEAPMSPPQQGHVLQLFDSTLSGRLSGTSLLEEAGWLKKLKKPADHAPLRAQLRALRCDARSLLSRAVISKDHYVADQLLQLGRHVVTPNSLLASSVQTRKYEQWYGYRLIHAAVAEADLQMLHLLEHHGAGRLPSLTGEAPITVAGRLKVSTLVSIELMKVLLPESDPAGGSHDRPVAGKM